MRLLDRHMALINGRIAHRGHRIAHWSRRIAHRNRRIARPIEPPYTRDWKQQGSAVHLVEIIRVRCYA